MAPSNRLFPWSDMIQFVHARATSSQSLTREMILEVAEAIQPGAEELAEGSPMDLMDKLGLEIPFSPPTDWCVAMLKHSDKLGQIRYRLVPRFLEEESFWSRYFGRILFLIKDELESRGMEFREDENFDNEV